MKRVKSKMRRAWSIVLTAAMMISMCGMPAVTAKATEATEVICNHVCDENCGGMQAVSGSAVTACTHVHDETCGYAEETEAMIIESGDCSAEGSSVQWTLDDSGTFTVSGTGAMADYTSNTLPWKDKCSSITSLIVEDGVTAIGQRNFDICTKLTSVEIPDSVTTIGQSAFSGCTRLTDIKIPDSVTTIGKEAFFNTGLTSIVIPGSVTSLGKGAFGYCSGLTSVTIPDSVTSIDEAFIGCTGLTNIEIPDSVTKIYKAFYGCTRLTSVTIPDSVTSIDEAFIGCTGLTSVKIPDRVTSINGAFYGCTGLTSITIPDSVTTIGNSAFDGCTGLTSITIPDSVTTIDHYVFHGCTGLKSITIPHSVTSIESSAFDGCTNLTTVTTSCTPQFNYIFGDNVTVIAEHSYTYTDNGDGTHSFNCSVCGSIDTEDHDFSYNANNNVITASCNKCETTGTATITAENVTYTGSAYANASVSYSDNWPGNRDLTIVYKQGETILDAAPANAGDYTAYIEYEGAGVSVYFTIAKADSAVATVPTVKTGLTYTGSAQELVTGGTTNCGTIQYSREENGTYSETIPTGTDAKTYTVWYKVVGDENHNDTTPASVEVTIAPKSVTVTADDKSKTYGEADSELTYTVTGLEGSDTLTGTLSRETGDNVGAYAITQGTLNNPNYDIAFVGGTFTINKATPVSPETPEAAAITYGDTLSSSVLDDSSWAWLDGTIVPDAHTDCIAYIEVDDINYDYTGINGYDSANHRVVRDIVVTINKATLTITAKSYAIKVGATLPTYEYTVTGLVGDDTLPVDVTISCSATDNNAVGAYPITVSYEVSDSTLASCYEINCVDGTLTISEKDTQEITADDIILTYGETENIGATTNGDGTITYATTSDVISVAEDGMITALKAGTATVTICAAETADYAEAAKTISVTVNKAENAPNLPSATMNVSYDTKTVGAVTLPTGWTWEAADVTKTLTTGEAVTAIALYKGADAGNYETETVEVVITRSACSHSGDTELKNASATTCTVAGYTGDLYCKDCGERISVGQSISAPGHNYNSEVTTEATTTSEGVRTYTCENCGDSYTQSIPKLPMPTNTPIPLPTATPSPSPIPTTTPSPIPTATPTSEPTPTLEPTPEPEELPHIQGEDGKSGWDAIIDEIEVSMKNIVEDSEEKVVVTVEMNGSTKVPKDIFEQIAEKDISVEFMLADGLMWTVNGKTVETEELKDFNLAVALETEDKPLENIPLEVINTVSGERDSLEINLAYSGEFGFEAILTIGLEKKNAGLYANLFFYNEETGELEFICADVIAADGKAELSFTHASDYLVVLSEESMEPVQEDAPVTELNYTIVKGDTLSKIAAKYGCTVKEIVELNKELIQNPDMIQIGWKLRIPVKGAKPAPEQETPAVPVEDKKYVVYVVKKGDTLWVISQQCGCTVKDIMELNRELIKSPDLIHTGWELMVPEK